ncbi:MAG: hypothetical protein B6D68_03200 [spirochete symbiont of Stewartia floridana]|nr:MAG: hypothetical protein B6D68_03200 [spirochete symbiont of Stewartia floridana]
MFTSELCKVRHCNRLAWSDVDYCPEHHPDRNGYAQSVYNRIAGSGTVIEQQNWCDIDLTGLEISGKLFRNCCFSSSRFNGANLHDIQFFTCMLDKIEAEDCRFNSVQMLSTHAAGSLFSRSRFTDCDLINVNFNGIKAVSAVFEESDLYGSRFIESDITNASFSDCNLTAADFTGLDLENVFFDEVNLEEANMTSGYCCR